MKKFLSITILILFFAYASKAQWVNANAPTLAAGNSIYFASTDTGYMVSADFNNGGQIFKTSDGQNWTNQLSTNDYLFAVHFISNQVGWAGGGQIGGGLILKTIDGGVTWITQTNSCEQVLSIFFVNDTLGWAAATDASQGTFFIYNTINGGQTWTTQQTGTDYVRAVFFIDETTGWVAGDNGKIYGTTDGGANWNLLTTGVVFHFNDISFVSPTEGWAVGQYGNGGCYKTIDGGVTWIAQTLPTITPLTSVHFVNANEGWACGNNGLILRTNDGGNNWQQEVSSTSNSLSAIFFVNANIGYATGFLGTVIKYSNPVEVKSNIENSGVLLYPNPNNGVFQLVFSKQMMNKKVLELEVFDVTGKSVEQMMLISNEPYRTIDLSRLSEGFYFLKFKLEKEIISYQIIINK